MDDGVFCIDTCDLIMDSAVETESIFFSDERQAFLTVTVLSR
jgi:hypothetical protein